MKKQDYLSHIHWAWLPLAVLSAIVGWYRFGPILDSIMIIAGLTVGLLLNLRESQKVAKMAREQKATFYLLTFKRAKGQRHMGMLALVLLAVLVAWTVLASAYPTAAEPFILGVLFIVIISTASYFISKKIGLSHA
ncbi:MAG: hypothetical protein ACREF7_04615 [Candidatus Saccharimonadales bacterium]